MNLTRLKIKASKRRQPGRRLQLALLGGADDFGGVLVEENVLRTAGHVRANTRQGVEDLIRQAGFTPVQRDSHYREFRGEEKRAGDSRPAPG